MKFIKEIIENVWVVRSFLSVLTLLISFGLYKLLSFLLFHRFDGDNIDKLSRNKSKTYVKLFKNILRYAFVIGTVIVLLHIFGVNVTSLVAGIGIAGAIIGLAIQDWLKDIIRGTSIISDSYYAVGDVVKYKNFEGKIISFGLKTTKIQDLATKNVISVANRNIDEVEVESHFNYIRIPMPYEVSVEKAEEVIAAITARAKSIKNLKECNYLGVTELADSSIMYLLQIVCMPADKLQIRRDVLRTVLLVYAEYGVEVPFNQLDVHQK